MNKIYETNDASNEMSRVYVIGGFKERDNNKKVYITNIASEKAQQIFQQLETIKNTIRYQTDR